MLYLKREIKIMQIITCSIISTFITLSRCEYLTYNMQFITNSNTYLFLQRLKSREEGNKSMMINVNMLLGMFIQ